MSSLITLVDVNKHYLLKQQKTPILKNIHLQIQTGELLAVMGASGSGKTTLMNILGLLDRPSSGQYFLNGTDISTCSDDELSHLRGETIGFVFQFFYLLPRLTALDNVWLPLRYHKNFNLKDAKERAHIQLEKLGLAKHTHQKPNELSGGQQQRVAIARALIANPRIILADEPTGALDSKTGQSIIDLFRQLHDTEHRTVILVTHDSNISAQCNRIIHIQDGVVHE